MGRADEAGADWSRTTPRQRADVLHAWYDKLVAHTEDLAHLISREMGKPLSEARGEVKYGTDFVRWYAEEAVRPGGNFREVAGRRGQHPDPPLTRRPGGTDHPLELPPGHGHPQDRTGPRGWLPGGRQTRNAHPADHVLCRPACRRGRSPGRTSSR